MTDHHPPFADPIAMQHRLFAELSLMFGREVPLYDKSLAVNDACNRVVCDLLSAMHQGLAISDGQIEKTSGERHGAIRIGRADEYRWIGRFFACFGMHPHNFYDMTSVGAKSQPVIATGFRSVVHPEHRVFTSLLQTSYFDDETKARVDALLETRQVFSDRAIRLIEKAEAAGGLSWDDAEALIAEGTERIFKWTGAAHDPELYEHLCKAGFKIAADVACFRAHHLNHLTPNTFCMDLYTSAMKFLLGEIDRGVFVTRATRALERLQATGDRDFLRLCFKHLTRAEVESYARATPAPGTIEKLVDELLARLEVPELDLSLLAHNGFKDHTEGPAVDTPLLLRQDAYKALTEPVSFTDADGGERTVEHTARFGEIEQRFYATTPRGRALYDDCLARVEEAKAESPSLVKDDFDAYLRMQAECFSPFPKTLRELLEQGLVYGRFEPTESGLSAASAIETIDLFELVRCGYVAYEGLRYEDFLPVSAAGIFASNLSQYGTQSTATERPEYTQRMLEDILGCAIIDSDVVYRGLQADSILQVYTALGVLDRVDRAERERLARDMEGCPPEARTRFAERSVLAAKA
ncbi:MAG: DUF1338 family protein [Planctomycetota bacterium]